jgi:hypothetical protein
MEFKDEGYCNEQREKNFREYAELLGKISPVASDIILG